MSMSPAMLASLRARNPLLVHLLRVELPGRTIRLIDGAGQVFWGAEVFEGADPEFGTISGFEDFTESEGTEAPRQTIQLLPRGNGAVARLTSPMAQGSPVSIYAAAVDPRTGVIVGEPDPRFLGELDTATVRRTLNGSLLSLECSTIWERLFDDNEGNRWNHTFWTHLFGPGARAFEHVHNAGAKMHWGYMGPPKGSGGSSYGGGGSIGGGGGGDVLTREIAL